MSYFNGYLFYIFLLITTIPAIYLGLHQKTLKYYRLFITAISILLVFGITKELVLLLVYISLAIFVLKFYLRERITKKQLPYFFSISLVLSWLCISKVSLALGHPILGFLGLSYIFFRVIQIIIEIRDGLIKELGVLDTLDFLLFFPAFSSGPIARSRQFLSDSNRICTKFEYDELLSSGISKIVLGLLYKFPLASYSKLICDRYMLGHPDILHVLGYAYIYGFYLFFDFAGISLLAIGTGYIFGVKLPDNFNKPFISLNIKDFWNRWHISLSHWLRDFVFTRFVMLSIKKKWFRNRNITVCSGYMINMVIIGMWHGLTVQYVTYGIYHGFLLALTEIYEQCSFHKKNKDKSLYKLCQWFLTINLVMFGFLIFSGKADISHIYRLILNL